MQDKDVSGIVFNVQKFSVHDGKGIRTMIFLKGCPLRCRWCSNPESQRREPERAFNATRCLTASVCGRCVAACKQGAIAVSDGLLCQERVLCKECFACVEACPSGAQSVYGTAQTVDQVLRRVEEDSVFYARSGGGLTLSGGEAMQQSQFVLALLREAKVRRINSALETCGHYGWEELEAACRLLNTLIFDIKSVNNAKHKKFVGVSNDLILRNFARVCEEFPELPLHVRTPVIPGFNDTEEDIKAIRDMLPQKANVRYELLPYHRMGQPKYEYIGKKYTYEGVSLDETVMQRLKALV